MEGSSFFSGFGGHRRCHTLDHNIAMLICADGFQLYNIFFGKDLTNRAGGSHGIADINWLGKL